MVVHGLEPTTLAKEKWDNRAQWGTGAWSLEHVRACSSACVAVSIFLARVVLVNIPEFELALVTALCVLSKGMQCTLELYYI